MSFAVLRAPALALAFVLFANSARAQDTCLPSYQCTVTSTADDNGSGTLRVAIDNANNTPTPSTRVTANIASNLANQTITLVNVPVGSEFPRPLPLAISRENVTVSAADASGLTITRNTANTSFSIDADGTIFRDISLVSLGGFSLSSDLTFDQDRYDGEVSAAITGSGGIIKTGDRQLTLSGSNSYSGTTLLSAGTLVVTTDAIKSSNVDLDSGTTLVFSQNNNGVYALQIKEVTGITGVANLLKQGTGTVTLDRPSVSANSWSGTTVIEDGTLLIRQSGNNPNSQTPGGLPADASVTLSNPTSILEFDSNAGILSNPQEYGGIASGAGKLVKSGAGTFELTGANSYTGGTEVTAGNLKIVDPSTIPIAGGIAVSSGAVIEVEAADGTDIAVGISGGGSLIKYRSAVGGAGTSALTLSGANSYTGGTTVKAGLTGNVQQLIGTTSSIPLGVALEGFTQLIFDQGFSGTNSGVISGEGKLVKKDVGAVALTGANTYSGGTTVEEGSLVVTTSSLPGVVTVGAAQQQQKTELDLAIPTQKNIFLIFDQNFDGQFEGQITGNGTNTTLVKRGSGSVSLIDPGIAMAAPAPQQFTPARIVVEAGKLVIGDAVTGASVQPTTPTTTVSGSGTLELASLGYLLSNVTIASGGTLAGNSRTNKGLFGITLVQSGGQIAPGNAAAPANAPSLILDGNLTFAAGSIFSVGIDDQGNTDKILAKNGLTVISAGALLKVNVAPGDYQVAAGQPPISGTIYTAGTGATFPTNEFTLSAPDFVFIDVDPKYNAPPNITLEVTLNPNVDIANFANTANQAQVGGALSAAGVPYGTTELDESLQVTTQSELLAALNQLDGTPITSSFTTRQAESERFQRSLARRMRVYADRGSPARRFAPPRQTGSLSAEPRWLRDSLLFESTDGPKAGQTGWGTDRSGGPATGFGGWLDGYGVFGSVDQSVNAPGFDYQVYGAAAGADYSFQQPFLLGASLAYARTELDGYTGLNASGGGDTVRGSLYTAYAQPDLAAYASLQLSYAWSDFDEKRRIQFASLNQNAKGSYTGNEFSTYAELGTRAFELGADIRLRPFIGVGYGYFEREGFDESGAPTGANLSVDSQSYQSLDLAAGATIDQVIDLGPRLRLRTELRARYDHEFLDTNPKLNARISGQPFEVSGVSIGRDIGLVGLGVEFIDAGGLSTFLGYDARFNTEFVEHNATIGILVRF